MDSKSFDQVQKNASLQVCTYMQVCKYAFMQVYTGVYKKLNKKKENHRWYVKKIWNANKCEAIYMSAVAAFFPYFLHMPKPNIKISCEIAVIQDRCKSMFTVIKKGHGLCLGNPGLSERV